MENIYDVIIIGSGPSGLSTALHLDRLARGRELATLILEKVRHPRHKLCAGGILSEGEAILSKLGLDLNEVPYTDVKKAHFGYKARGLNLGWGKRPVFRTIRRNEFDFWLASKARERGIEIQEGITVKKVESHHGYAHVQTDQGEYRAKVVVGADGSNSVVRRSVMGKVHPHVGRALEVIIPSTPSQPPPNSSNLGEEHAIFDFLPIPKGISGYVWDFPALVNGEPMRCWGIYDSNSIQKSKRAPLREVLADEMKKHGYELNDYKLEGHPIRWYEPANTPAIPHVLLVGDALGVDALLGEGISPALGYGRVATEAILDAFEKNDFSFQDYKGRLLRTRLGGALWRRTFIAKLFYLFETDFWQRFVWHYFNWIAGLIGLLFVIGWEKKKK
jgi:flavin-dependent dehydrogenase